jgi:hypothetical protein
MALTRIPARVPIAEGESFSSYVHRLAKLNDVPVKDISGFSGRIPEQRVRPELVDHVSTVVDITRSRLENSTMVGCSGSILSSRSPWRLRTTVWECTRCAGRGIRDRDRGLVVLFSCVRCKTMLSAGIDTGSEGELPIELDSTLLAVQHELLDAFHRSADDVSASGRLERLSRAAFWIGQRLSRREWSRTSAPRFPDVDAHDLGLNPSERRAIRAMGLPEHPALFAEVFRTGWEMAASPYVDLLSKAGVRESIVDWPGGEEPPRIWERLLPERLAAIPAVHPTPPELMGRRLRELRDDYGLRSVHVPNEIRYAGDPLVLDETTWHWRRRVCGALYHWLSRLEHASSPSRWPVNPYFDQYRIATEPQQFHGTPAAVEAAAGYGNQVLQLAETLVQRGLSDCVEPGRGIPSELRQRVAPNASRSRSTARLVDLWVWLDEVAGTDAHARVPSYMVSDLAQLDEELGYEGKLALRQYRAQSATRDAEHATKGSRPSSRPSIRTA